MPNLDWNKTLWGGAHDWRTEGEEWSNAWGGSEAQWFGALLPRVHRLLPARRILEIAPGYGRWTKFLLPVCEEYLGIDLAENCITACRERFRDAHHARFSQNDGLSLDDAGDESFDFIFSFDSLVHAELDIFEKYIPQLVRKLSPDGVAFIHHSNLAGFENPEGFEDHARAKSVSARTVAEMVSAAGGREIVQEIINWHNAGPIDCLTTFGRHNGTDEVAPIRLINMRFTEEAALISAFQRPYCNVR